MREERSVVPHVTERISYFQQDSILQSFNAHEAAYVRGGTYNRIRRTARGPFFPPNLFLFSIRDRVTWLWNLSKEPAPRFLERRLRRKVYAKYLWIFRDSWYVFGTSCYYLDNMNLIIWHSFLVVTWRIFSKSYDFEAQSICCRIDKKCFK